MMATVLELQLGSGGRLTVHRANEADFSRVNEWFGGEPFPEEYRGCTLACVQYEVKKHLLSPALTESLNGLNCPFTTRISI